MNTYTGSTCTKTMPTQKQFISFKKTVWSYYKEHKRAMSWREDITPYRVVVSEIMLQQTQVVRVMEKFPSFMQRFPSWQELAEAPTKDVLQEWSGLGYNRRALFLKRIAETITKNGAIKGTLPRTIPELTTLPGIGANTAGSILAFTYNIPHPFIETNIRSVFIHHFFAEIEKSEGKKACKKIDDADIMPLIEQTLDHDNPREWYYALMDYGSFLKKQLPNPSRQSKHHVMQKPFKGSNREIRSKILQLIMKKPMSMKDIEKKLTQVEPTQISSNLGDLTREGFITKKNSKYIVMD